MLVTLKCFTNNFQIYQWDDTWIPVWNGVHENVIPKIHVIDSQTDASVCVLAQVILHRCVIYRNLLFY